MSAVIPDEMPAAWIGFRSDPKRFVVIRVCGWCPDKAQADAIAKHYGWEVTHTICPSCAVKLNNSIIPDSI